MSRTRKIAMTFLALTLVVSCVMFGLSIKNVNAEESTAPILNGFMVEEGMYIRTIEPDGLRFKTTLAMNDSEYAASGITEIGLVLMPAHKVTGELTIDEQSGDVKALLIQTVKWTAGNDENSKAFYSTLVNTGETGQFPSSFFNTPVSARAYAKYSDSTIKYSANTVTRSMGYVATMGAAKDEELAEDETVDRIVSGTTKTVSINNNASLNLGSLDTYPATLIIGGIEVDASEISWSVTSGDAVSVSAGVVTPMKVGSATLRATVGSIVVDKAIIVTAPEVVMSFGRQIALVGEDSAVPEVTVTVDGVPDASPTVSFTSGDAGKFTVSGNTITGVAHGDTTLTASYTVGRYTVEKSVNMTVFDHTVSTVSEFKAITGSDWYVMKNNIDFSGSGEHSLIAGDFSGVLDGNGYSVSNVKLAGLLDNGMFETVSGTIRRIGFTNMSTTPIWSPADRILNTGFVARTITGTLEDVYLQGTLSGYALWGNDPSHWSAGSWADAKAGAVCSNGEGATFKNLIVNVEFSTNTDAFWVCGGTPTYGNVTLIMPTNVPTYTNNMSAPSLPGTWFGAASVNAISSAGVWRDYFDVSSPNTWNIVDGEIPTLINNCTGVVPTV